MVGGKGQKKYKRPIMAMKNRKSKLSQYSSLCVVVLLLLVLVNVGVCQNCGCPKDLCCSRYGYCGTGNAYCGEDCREGPCYPSLPPTGDVSYIIFLIYVTTSPHPIWNTIEDVGSITASVFNSIVGGAASGCAGMGFYNYNAFITAANAFNGFGTSGSSDFQKREVAAFFANAAHETGGFCFIEEQNTADKYCQASSQYPCNPNKRYYGRGPLQLSWNFNYGAAGNYINFDGLNNPEAVATDPTISFKTAVWFWMLNSNCHKAITSGQGFGATIKAINSMECNGGNPAAVTSRVNYYQKFSQQLNIDPGSNLRC